MAKIIGEIVTEIHELEKVKVKRPRSNEFLIQVDPADDLLTIQQAIRQAISTVSPFVRNCPIGHWTGRATTYVTIQPLSDELVAQLVTQIDKIRPQGLNLITDQHSVPGRLQLLLHTPSPEDRIEPADRPRGYMDGPWLD